MKINQPSKILDDTINNITKPVEYYLNWRYKNTGLLILSLIIFVYFAESSFIDNIITAIGDLGYIGAVISGILFVSTFTVAPGAAILFHLAERLNPYEVALLAGVGGVIGDYIILRVLKDKVFEEISPLFSKLGGSYISIIFRTPYFAWLTPLIGALIMASPLPDEAGIGLIGLSKIKNWQFILLSFTLNVIGIFIIVTLAANQ